MVQYVYPVREWRFMAHYYYCDQCGYVYLELSRKRLHQCVRCKSKQVTERFVAKKDLSEIEIITAEIVREKLEDLNAPP